MNINRRIVCAITACVTAASLCSCEKKAEHIRVDTVPSISFSWWGSDARSDYTITGLGKYADSNKIEIQPSYGDFVGYKENLDILMAAGKESDIMQINYSWLKEYSPDGDGFYDLEKLVSYVDLENFSEEELSYGRVNGKLNAIPISLNAVTFYYNETLLDKYGLDIPKTWDDLFVCADKLSPEGICVLDSADIYCWLMLVAHETQISGKEMFTDSGIMTYTSENIISMMEFYRRLIDGGVMMYGTAYDKSHFFNSQTAGQLLWVSDAQYYAAPLEESGESRVAIGDYLTQPESTAYGWYVKPTSLYAVSKNTEHPQEAANLLNYLLNNEQMVTLQGTEKGVPLSRSALETLDGKNMLFGVSYEASRMIKKHTDFSEDGSDADYAQNLKLMPESLENSDIYKSFFEQFDLYYYEQKSIEEAAADFMQGIW